MLHGGEYTTVKVVSPTMLHGGEYTTVKVVSPAMLHGAEYATVKSRKICIFEFLTICSMWWWWCQYYYCCIIVICDCLRLCFYCQAPRCRALNCARGNIEMRA